MGDTEKVSVQFSPSQSVMIAHNKDLNFKGFDYHGKLQSLRRSNGLTVSPKSILVISPSSSRPLIYGSVF